MLVKRGVSWYYVILDMMLKRKIIEKAIHITWLSVAITFCWPVPLNSSKTQVFIFKVLQIISIINVSMLLLPLLYSIYLHYDDIIIVSKSISLSVGLIQVIAQTAICFVKYDSLQVSFYPFYLFHHWFYVRN